MLTVLQPLRFAWTESHTWPAVAMAQRSTRYFPLVVLHRQLKPSLQHHADTFTAFVVCAILQSAERLQIAINKWEPIADMTTIRSGGCAATGADNCFYVMGGYDGTTRLNTCEYYNPDTGEWSPGPQMVKRRSGADAATGPDGSIYVAERTD